MKTVSLSYVIGDSVCIDAIQQDAMVVGIYIAHNRVTYDVRYWLDGEMITVTLDTFELKDCKLSVGIPLNKLEHDIEDCIKGTVYE